MNFRKHPKASLETRIPVEIVREVGLRSVNQGKVQNQVVAELLCAGLGMDPSRFGLAPGESSPGAPSAN